MFFPFRKSAADLLMEVERVFGSLPSPRELTSHIDRDLTRTFQRQFDLIKEAAQEISRRVEAGEVDRDAADAARGQMTLQVGKAFKTRKAEALSACETGIRHFENGEWEDAVDAFSTALELSPAPPIHLAIVMSARRLPPGNPKAANTRTHYAAALEGYRREAASAELPAALIQTALFHFKDGRPDEARPLIEEARVLLDNLGDRKRGALLKRWLRGIPLYNPLPKSL
jgi:tetratricopeptide (TPR) repeat protein